MYCMISYVKSTIVTHRYRKQDGGYQGLSGGKMARFWSKGINFHLEDEYILETKYTVL